MTLLELDQPVRATETASPVPPGRVEETPPEVPPAPGAGRTLFVAFLATSAAAWMTGGVFVEFFARLVAVAAGAVGVGGVAFALRRGRVALQYLLVPVAFAAGYSVALLLPNATGVRGTVPELVRAALSNGGLAEPPIPFDPGWRFLVVVLAVLVGAAAASIATASTRPRLAVLVPLPVVVAGALQQPEGRDLLSGAVALVLLIAALLVSYTNELAEESEAGALSRAFELRQLARGGAATVAVLLVLVALSRASLLFPSPNDPSKAQPQKPQVQPLSAVKDRPLFTVRSTLVGPWRLGVLDGYDGSAWLLPPYDPTRAVDVGSEGQVPGPRRASSAADFTIRDLGGFTLPAPIGAVRIDGAKGDVGFDPRTQVFRTRRGAAGPGFAYRVEAARPPSGAELRAVGSSVDDALRPLLAVPAAPVEVQRLLDAAPINPFERLQYLRAKLYAQVVAAGSGVPVDVPPARVVDLLAGGEASPFEIVASEALLARWSGLPSRIGYGFNGGTVVDGGREFRPRDGANWLEVHLNQLGWVTIVGIPPKARSSLTADPKNSKPTIRPSDQLTLQVYLPIRNEDPLQLFQVLRYYLVSAMPFLLGLALLLATFTYPLKVVRSRRRRRWGLARGPAGRIAVAYAEFRDLAVDLAIGSSTLTPLEFLQATVDDDEHGEFAWLVTRSLWGDLSRDLRDEDAEAAEAMANSLRRRLAGAQPAGARAAAAVSRASLRGPYDRGLPNLWPAGRPRRSPLRTLRLVAGRRVGRARVRSA